MVDIICVRSIGGGVNCLNIYYYYYFLLKHIDSALTESMTMTKISYKYGRDWLIEEKNAQTQ